MSLHLELTNGMKLSQMDGPKSKPYRLVSLIGVNVLYEVDFLPFLLPYLLKKCDELITVNI